LIITIGRSPKNDFVLTNRTVSREHATMEIVEGQIVLRDVGSKSGTYVMVDGSPERTTYSIVEENAVILIGNEPLRVLDIIHKATRKNRKVKYVRNPLTGVVEKQ
jgi:predicted component of type VI protein secretion system